ncbi:MAG TPA: penicillin-binding transpeptidase domain-containing protein [Thermoleophilaceae bacterium]|nr:penicillin-binding transpeptidase domain-containing protein [Thermoleophilaceae bacterium]
MLAAISLLGGLLFGAFHTPASVRAGRDFARAWERGDFDAMYALLTDDAKRETSRAAFRAAYRDDAMTATLRHIRIVRVRRRGDRVELMVAATTNAFGTVRSPMDVPVVDSKIAWERSMTFPGKPAGARLTRQTKAPQRASILARNVTVIATGPASARVQPAGAAAQSVAGGLGEPQTQAERNALRARGFPPGTLVGTSGLERIAENRVAGVPGGLLSAGGRVLASTQPKPADAVRTTIDLNIQQAAITALAGRYGGVAALDARTGEVRALAGIAFSGPQPPGSTFKIITAAAALDDKLVKLSTPFPVETKAVIDGVNLENANGESCGGTFAQSFAHSCNSVFAPLGVRLGARRIVDQAERLGWNDKPSIPGALPSTIPPASEVNTPLAVGSTAIGQGKVLATPLQMASVAQAISQNGVMTRPRVFPDAPPDRKRVMSRRVAHQLERLMIDVVSYGTGTSASLSPVKVAGKTGTAELTTTVQKEGETQPLDTGVPAKPPGYDTDAWFAAYAPVRRSKVAVSVLIVHGGAGGSTAAPAARGVLQAGLER